MITGIGVIAFVVQPGGRRSLIVWIAAAALLMLIARAGRYGVRKLMRSVSHGARLRTVVLVGPGYACAPLIDKIRAAPRSGFKPICIFDTESPGASGKNLSINGVRVCPGFDALASMVHARMVNEIWIALPFADETTLQRFVREFRHDFVNIRYMPAMRLESLCNHAAVEMLGAPTINLAASRGGEADMLPKWVFDRVFSATALLMLWPLLLAVAIAVKCSSPGPVFFRQKRMGADGREFLIYKFRSMHMHTEAPGQLRQASRSDARVTRIGAFLRRTSIDELPQLINVVRGDMSIVGPRPHALEHDNLYKDLVDGYMYRYRIKPGITGLAQISGCRGETERVEQMQARVRLDLHYMQHWSFWLDLKIVMATVVRGFTGTTAY
jgi:putative colanic acid biosynthesis UDP-glucose lipid carrier transferase